MAASVKLKLQPEVVEHCLDLHKKMIVSSGLWATTEPQQKQRFNAQLYVLTRLAVAVGTLIVISQIVDSTSNFSNMEFLTENLYVSIIFTMSIVKIVTVMQKPEDVKRLILRLEAMKRDDNTSLPEEKRIFTQYRIITYRLTIAFCIVCGITSSGFALIPVTDTTPNATVRILPVRMWTPFEHTTTPNYEAMYVILCVMAVCAGLAIAVFDTLFVGMMLATIGQLKILQHKLSNLRAIALGNVGQEKKGKSLDSKGPNTMEDETSKLQVIATPGTVLYRRIKPATYDRIVVEKGPKKPPGKRKDANMLFGDRVDWYKAKHRDVPAPRPLTRIRKSQALDKEMHILLGGCVEHHIAILEFIDDMEQVFWGALVFQIFTSLAICVVVYQVTRAPSLNVKVVVMLMIIGAGVFQLFMYCWFSTVITHESYNLNEAMYYSDWLNMSPSLQRSMQIIMCRTEQSPQLKVAGFVPLSLVMFRRVLKQSYSMYSLITGLDSGIALALNDLGI